MEIASISSGFFFLFFLLTLFLGCLSHQLKLAVQPRSERTNFMTAVGFIAQLA